MRFFILELKRALKEKSFWLIMIFLIIMFVLVTLPNYLPMKLDVLHDSTNKLKISYNAVDVWVFFLNSRPLTTFIALFPVLIYTHSFVDDVNSKYSDHIILRIGFKKYFFNKLLVCLMLGGTLLFGTSAVSFLLCHLIYTGDTNTKFHAIFTFMDSNISFYNPTRFMIFVSLILFFTGMVYAALGFLLSLYTDNKILIYGLSTLSLGLYEAIVYSLSHLLGLLTGSKYTVYYFTYSILSNLGSYTDWKLILIFILLFILILSFIKTKYNSIKLDYEEG